MKQDFLDKNKTWVLFKNAAAAMAQITFYYIDLIKDIVFITFFFEFLPKTFSVNTFEYNLFFLLCFSVLLPGELKCYLIYIKKISNKHKTFKTIKK
jgi:hypothetical protein